MFFADIRQPIRFEINLNYVFWVLEESCYTEPTDCELRVISRKVEDIVYSKISKNQKFNLVDAIISCASSYLEPAEQPTE